MRNLKITIAVPENAQEEVDHLFREFPNVNTTCGNIFDIEADSILVPLNTFGFFDGGFPLLVTDKLGLKIQDELQKRIMEKHFGELLVGQAEVIPTGIQSPAFVISAPLFRALEVDLTNTVNVYLAMRGALLEIRNNPSLSIHSIILPLLGVDPGGLTPYASARQIRYAIRTTRRKKPRKLEHLSKAKRREQSLKRTIRKSQLPFTSDGRQ